MMRFARMATIASAALLGLAAVPAHAAFEEYKDYELSQEVWYMTTVRVDEGQFDTYLEGLKRTWIDTNEIAKKLGHITDYAIYTNMLPAGDAFDLILLIKLPNTESTGPSKKRYDEFMAAYSKTKVDADQKTVTDLYNKIRTIDGTYMLREVKVK